MTLNKPPCDRDCKDRNIGCHGKCAKYIEWKKAYMERKKAIQKYNRSIADIDSYEIFRKQKDMKAKGYKR